MTQGGVVPSPRVCFGNAVMTTAQLASKPFVAGAENSAARTEPCLPQDPLGLRELRDLGTPMAPQGVLPVELAAPRYQLTVEIGHAGNPHAWRFVLRSSDGHRVLTVEDCEPDVDGEQLELLTLIRGLEALDQPSAVTAYGCSRYLRHGITYGLPEWRENGWQWERFGQLVAIKHAELWQRLDRAMQIHRFTCGVRRIDASHGGSVGRYRPHRRRRSAGGREGFADWIKYSTQILLLAVIRVIAPSCAGIVRKPDWA